MADCRKNTFVGLAALAAVVGGFACGDDQPMNRAPEVLASIGDFEVEAGDSVTKRVSQNFSDPDGDELTYSATSANTSLATTSVDEAEVMVKGVAVGTVGIIVTATDPDGLSASDTAEAIVEEANQAPVVEGDGIPDVTITVGLTFDLDLSFNFSDPDGDQLTFTAQSNNPGVATAVGGNWAVTLTGVSVGMATVTVTATDPGGLSVSDDFVVTVEEEN